MTTGRLDELRTRLSPNLEARIASAFADGSIPRVLLEGLPPSAVDAVSAGRAPLESLSSSISALEAIVQRFGRPPLLVRNDKVVLESLADFAPGTDTKIKGTEKWVPSVGRIEFVNASMGWGGTGWVADRSGSSSLVITNRHVAQIVCRRRSDSSGVFMRAPSGARYGAAIDFREEVDGSHSDTRTARITSINYLADDWSADVAILKIESADFELPTPFELSDRRLEKDHLVALIGYPAYDSRNNRDDQARYFRDLYEVKRFAPGKILQAQTDEAQLSHDCTSLGGNSGSPLIDLEDGRVVGIHFAGVYGRANSAVSVETLKRLLAGDRPKASLFRSNEEGRADSHHDGSWFKGRKGFATCFLHDGSVETPWPTLSADLAGTLATPDDEPVEPNELRYTHFGVKYSALHKLPLVTAVNVDGACSVRIKRGVDRWFTDGRIPLDIQLGSKNFADPEIDRGHMVRREDPNWSSTGNTEEAQRANDDTFHYVNAAAQHSLLNQGKSLWQGLENYILDSARTHGMRACVFTGPIMRASDEEQEELVIDGAIVPLEFWKVVATLDEEDRGLRATAYVLTQGQLLRKLIEKRRRRESLEGFVLGAYRTFQISVADLEDATGYNFGPYREADPLVRMSRGQEAHAVSEPIVIGLESMTDIRL